MENLPKVLQSSANKKNVSLSIQGAVVLLLIAILPKFGIDLSANDITLAIEIITVVIAGLATLAGILRKVYHAENI